MNALVSAAHGSSETDIEAWAFDLHATRLGRGTPKEMISALVSLPREGGTALGAIAEATGSKQTRDIDLWVIVSDGIGTLGSTQTAAKKIRESISPDTTVVTVSAATTADAATLHSLAGMGSGAGGFVDLSVSLPADDATRAKAMLAPAYGFLGVDLVGADGSSSPSHDQVLRAVLPSRPMAVTSTASGDAASAAADVYSARLICV